MPSIETHTSHQTNKKLRPDKPNPRKVATPKRKSFFGSLLLALTRGLIGGIVVIAIVVGIVFGAYTFIHHLVAPDIAAYITSPAEESSKLYASDGSLLYEIYKDEKRTDVPLSEMSPYFIKAILAAEDRDFYTHPGVSATSIIRAALQDIVSPNQLSGGSTITQQLVKNSILTREKSLYRKVAEAIWAMELERHLGKDEILARYINSTSFGRNSAGIEAASMSYFGKRAKDLDAAESAYLAAMPKAPSLLSPGGPNRESLDARQQYILSVMHDLDSLNAEEYIKAKTETVAFVDLKNTIVAPYFTLWLKSQLLKQFGEDAVYTGGLKVYTTLDSKMQTLAEKTVQEYAAKNKKNNRAYNASLVAINPKTGGVLAMVGGKDYYGAAEPAGCVPGKNCLFEPNTNVATSLRQVGSSFKPYVYVTAFGPDYKFTPATIIADSSKNFSAPGAAAYIPHNYTGQQFGKVPIRKALAGSLNIAAVNTLSQIGIQPVIDTLRAVGITAPLQNCGLALALGACEISLLEHTGGFATIANMGKHNTVTGVDHVVGQNNKIIFQNNPENTQAINAQAAYELVDIMTDNDARSYIFGKKNPLTLADRKVAAKTGTTQNWKDGFTMGFTPSLAVGVWTGNNDGTLMRSGADGVVTAAPLWHAFIEGALAGTPAEDFPEPDGITRLTVNTATGKVVKGKTKGKLEVFASYAIPYNDFQLPPKAKKKVAATPAKPNYSDLIADNEEETVILEPWQNDTVYKTPFDVKVFTGSSSLETSVELSLDGKVIAISNSAPFLFTIEDKLTNGPHTLTAKATHFGLLESTNTVNFKTFFNPPPLSPRGQ